MILAPGSGIGAGSGMRRSSRWIRGATVRPIAMTRVHPIPTMPIANPERALVTMNESPCTVPTSPFAFA